MRIRQVKPEFWADAKLAELPERTRLFYIGLWGIADDAGWLRWDPVEAARELYGFESRKFRERRVVDMFGQLSDAGRVIAYPCGHVFIPKLTQHQHLAGSTRQVKTTEREHSRCAPPDPADARGAPPSPALVRLGNGQVSQGQVRSVNAHKREESDGEFAARLAEAGFDKAKLA